MSILLDLLILFTLIAANGFLSMAEMALVSARKVRLRQQMEEGDARAGTALRLAEEPGKFLSTVQIGITLVGILTGVFGGATLSTPLANQLARIDLIARWAQPVAVVVVVLLITYFSLVLGELVPKRLALNGAERIARRVAPVMAVLSRLTQPLVHLLSASTEAVVRLLGVKPSNDSPVTDEEVRVLLEQGAEVGIFEAIEEEIVGQLFRLSDLSIGALLTPRTDVTWLDVGDTPEEVGQKLSESNYSRYPLAEGDLDNVIGLVLVKDLFAASVRGQPMDLRAVMQPAVFIPDSMPALEALERLRQTRTHIALVIDEYGGLEGLVTLADFVEAIIGEVPDIGDVHDPEIVRRADGSYLLDGMLAIDRFQELLEIKELPEEDEGYYQTVGGFVMTRLGRVPTAGDSFDWDRLRLEVMDMDGRRVDKVLVTLLPEDAPSDSER
ncbi:MAG: hemolysin family protein [Caldilineaceae bacterium]